MLPNKINVGVNCRVGKPFNYIFLESTYLSALTWMSQNHTRYRVTNKPIVGARQGGSVRSVDQFSLQEKELQKREIRKEIVLT